MGELVVNKFPKSGVTEAIKSIRTNLTFSSINSKMKTILITSSTSSEGKSFISANLACAYANAGKKVIIVDCDLRRGRQFDIFRVGSKKGLSNLLVDENWKESFNDYIQGTGVENLDIMTTGVYPPNPTVLLESKKIRKVFKVLSEFYDVVILDAPPVIGLTDSLILSRLADINLIACKCKKTTIDMLNNTKSSLEGVGAKIGGVIFNGVDYKTNKYYNKYYNNSYYLEK